MKEKEEYVLLHYKTEIEHTELDLENLDSILGKNKNGHNHISIIKEENGEFNWRSEQEQIDIDLAIKTLQRIKDLGCNYAEIMYHCDHNGYVFYGIEMREATQEEIEEEIEKKKQKNNELLKEKIEHYKSEINSLMKQLK